MMKLTRRRALSSLMGVGLGLAACSSAWSAATLDEVMKARGLTQKDVLAAAKTYTPTGGRDEYLAFSSGEHHCIGAPLARLELQTAFRTLLAQLGDIHLLPDHPVEYLPGLSLRTLKALHLGYRTKEDDS